VLSSWVEIWVAILLLRARKAHPMSNLLEQAIRADDGSRTPKIIQGCARYRGFSFMKLRNPRNKQC
jgi:hypothetical protein